MSPLPGSLRGKGGLGSELAGRLCDILQSVRRVLKGHGDAMMQGLSAFACEPRVLRHSQQPGVVFIHAAVFDIGQPGDGRGIERVDDLTGTDRVHHGPQEASSKYQACIGVRRAFLYLPSHRPPIVHWNLKSANVFVERSGSGARAELLDVGLARACSRAAHGPWAGPQAGTAPEVVRRATRRPQSSADRLSPGMLLRLES